MSNLQDPYSDMKPVTVNATVPMGVCDGIYVTVSGNLAFTTLKGTAIAAFAVTAGQSIPCRAKSIDTGTTATVLAGYHTP